MQAHKAADHQINLSLEEDPDVAMPQVNNDSLASLSRDMEETRRGHNERQNQVRQEIPDLLDDEAAEAMQLHAIMEMERKEKEKADSKAAAASHPSVHGRHGRNSRGGSHRVPGHPAVDRSLGNFLADISGPVMRGMAPREPRRPRNGADSVPELIDLSGDGDIDAALMDSFMAPAQPHERERQRQKEEDKRRAKEQSRAKARLEEERKRQERAEIERVRYLDEMVQRERRNGPRVPLGEIARPVADEMEVDEDVQRAMRESLQHAEEDRALKDALALSSRDAGAPDNNSNAGAEEPAVEAVDNSEWDFSEPLPQPSSLPPQRGRFDIDCPYCQKTVKFDSQAEVERHLETCFSLHNE